jgi:hypothetical protein
MLPKPHASLFEDDHEHVMKIHPLRGLVLGFAQSGISSLPSLLLLVALNRNEAIPLWWQGTGQKPTPKGQSQLTPANSPFDPDSTDDPFRTTPLAVDNHRISPVPGLPYSVSSPKMSQLFNIFHPSDPISYNFPRGY